MQYSISTLLDAKGRESRDREAFLVDNNNKIMYLRHKSKSRNENGRALEGKDTFLQHANNVQQPSLTRLSELVPPWPLSFHNQRQKNSLKFNRSKMFAADMQKGKHGTHF